MPTFDLISVGCGGGPSENNLSAYIFKLSNLHWSEGAVAIEAGSGVGALNRLLQLDPDLLGGRPGKDDEVVRTYTASEAYSWIQCFLITHAHLDHINSLVLSAGSFGGPRRKVFGACHTLKDIESVFSDRIWPKLASWDLEDSHPLHLNALSPDTYVAILDEISVRMMPLSHGHNDTVGTYQSTAFFIRHNPTEREFLFFGDVEPDSIAVKPKNREVWKAAAPKIPENLDAIFIECSWPSGRSDDALYGHLSPEHLAAELIALAREVTSVRKEAAEAQHETGSGRARKRRRRESPPSPHHGALRGVRIFIIHCKEDLQGAYDQPINHVIADQVRELVQELGAEVIAVEQGMQISI